MARPGIEPRTSDLRVRCPTDCATRPGVNSQFIIMIIIIIDVVVVMELAHDMYAFYQCKKVITVKILKFGTPKTIAIIVLKIEKFDVTLH